MRKSLLASVSALSAIAVAANVVSAATPPSRPAVVRPQAVSQPLTQGTARTILVGGGATLPVIAYTGTAAGTGTIQASPTAKSILGFFDTSAAVVSHYCVTGSGAGKKVLDGAANSANPVTSFSQEAVNIGCTKPATGFGAPQTGTGFPISDPDFAGSDAPLTQGEIDTFMTNKVANANSVQPNRSQPVQQPYLLGAVGLYYNDPNLAAGQQIKLSAADICAFVIGTRTSFNGLSLVSGGTISGDTTAVKFVYRADNSGTSFSFTNFLATHGCKSSTVGVGANQSFATAVNVLPNGSVAATGNSGVATAIASTPHSIGYVEAANVSAAAPAQNLAQVINPQLGGTTGYDALKDLPLAGASSNFTTAAILSGKTVVQGAGAANSDSPATTAAITTAGINGQCILVFDPAVVAKPNAGYPILAATNLLFGATGNGSNAANLRKLADLFAGGIGDSTSVYYDNLVDAKDDLYNGLKTASITSVDAPTTNTTARSKSKTGYAAFPAAMLNATGAGSLNFVGGVAGTIGNCIK
ncbi:MAG: hypothetical protein NVSMB64_18920 [Candidatus Velthaea sp.]